MEKKLRKHILNDNSFFQEKLKITTILSII